MSAFGRWFGYGVGAALGKVVFGADGTDARERLREPIRQQTEDEIRAAERRYDEEAKYLEAELAAEKAAKKSDREPEF
jgi:hypothetical protein